MSDPEEVLRLETTQKNYHPVSRSPCPARKAVAPGSLVVDSLRLSASASAAPVIYVTTWTVGITEQCGSQHCTGMTMNCIPFSHFQAVNRPH